MTPPPATRPGRARTWLIALALYLAAAGVYLASPLVTSLDSYFSMQVTASLYRAEFGELSSFRPIIEERQAAGQLTYQVRAVGERLFSLYPIGAPLMAVPLLAVAELFEPDLARSLRFTLRPDLEKLFASLLAALAPALLFLALRGRGFAPGVALAGALALAFSTTLWSQAALGLWQHGPLLVAYGGLLWALAAPEPGPRRWFRAGLCAGLAYLIRPSAALAALPFGLLALRGGWARALAFGAGAAIGAGAALAYNLWAFGRVTPLYVDLLYPQADRFIEALAGLLVSPSRGLLVFSPVLLLAIPGGWRAWRCGWLRPLDRAVLAAALLQLLMIALWQHWAGGHSYGPRLQTDLLPFLVWFLCFALRREADAPQRRWAWAAFVLLFALGTAIHARGAFDRAVHLWNATPAPVSDGRVWDWSDPQFLRGW